MARAHLKLLAWQQSSAVYLCGADYLGIVHREGKKKGGGEKIETTKPASTTPPSPPPQKKKTQPTQKYISLLKAWHVIECKWVIITQF